MPISVKTLDFLVENRIQNSREWYHAHKDIYEKYVLEPMRELVELLAPTIHEIDPLLIAEPKVDRSISRVYRDTRFTHDKSLYREVMWCMFVRSKREFSSSPGFFFEYSPDGFRYGCGYYHSPRQVMAAARDLILERDKSFLAALKAYEKQDIFTLEGETYKRPHYPGEPENIQNWLDRKDMAFLRGSEDFELLFSENLYQTLQEGFLALRPMYEFLLKAEERSRADKL